MTTWDQRNLQLVRALCSIQVTERSLIKDVSIVSLNIFLTCLSFGCMFLNKLQFDKHAYIRVPLLGNVVLISRKLKPLDG